MKPSELLCGDLFAGAGGLSAGFHLEGFNSVFFNEIDEDASATFRFNFPTVHPFVEPIENLTAERVRGESGLGSRELDVMVGGPPCQGFSINAPIRTESDPRNHLFRHYVRLVLEGLRPKFIVFENVPGLISHEDGKTLQNVIQAFGDAGYEVTFKVLNAAHYGVPEERWRLIILGTRLNGVVPTLPTPEHFSLQRPNFTGGRQHTFAEAIGKPKPDMYSTGLLLPPVTVGEAMSDLPSIPTGGGDDETGYVSPPREGPGGDYQRKMRTLRDGTSSEVVFDHVCANLADVNLRRIEYVKPGGSWRDIPHELLPKGMQRARRSDHTRRYGRLDPKTTSGTILTKCDPHWGTVIHYKDDRIISVREAARIQSFPDWFRFVGGPRLAKYRQVGNAVPPLMARAIARHIKGLMGRTASVRDLAIAAS